MDVSDYQEMNSRVTIVNYPIILTERMAVENCYAFADCIQIKSSLKSRELKLK